jgi:hypothetical protein
VEILTALIYVKYEGHSVLLHSAEGISDIRQEIQARFHGEFVV